jgi:hypothetical protein
MLVLYYKNSFDTKKYFWNLFCKTTTPYILKVEIHDNRVLYRPDIVSARHEAKNHYSVCGNSIIILCLGSM